MNVNVIWWTSQDASVRLFALYRLVVWPLPDRSREYLGLLEN